MAYGISVNNAGVSNVFDDTFSAFGLYAEGTANVEAVPWVGIYVAGGTSAGPNAAYIPIGSEIALGTWNDVSYNGAFTLGAPAFWATHGLLPLVLLPNQWFFVTPWVVQDSYPSGNYKTAYLKGVIVYTYAPVGTAVTVKLLSSSHSIIPADTTPYGVRVFDPTGAVTFDSRMRYSMLQKLLIFSCPANNTEAVISDALITTSSLLCAKGGYIPALSAITYRTSSKEMAFDWPENLMMFKYTIGEARVKIFPIFMREEQPSQWDESGAWISQFDGTIHKVPVMIFNA